MYYNVSDFIIKGLNHLEMDSWANTNANYNMELSFTIHHSFYAYVRITLYTFFHLKRPFYMRITYK